MVVIVSAESVTLSVQFVSLLSGLKSVYTETFPLPPSVSVTTTLHHCLLFQPLLHHSILRLQGDVFFYLYS